MDEPKYIPIQGPCICGSLKVDVSKKGSGPLYVCDDCGRYYVWWTHEQLRLTLDPRLREGDLSGYNAWLREKVLDTKRALDRHRGR